MNHNTFILAGISIQQCMISLQQLSLSFSLPQLGVLHCLCSTAAVYGVLYALFSHFIQLHSSLSHLQPNSNPCTHTYSIQKPNFHSQRKEIPLYHKRIAIQNSSLSAESIQYVGRQSQSCDGEKFCSPFRSFPTDLQELVVFTVRSIQIVNRTYRVFILNIAYFLCVSKDYHGFSKNKILEG